MWERLRELGRSESFGELDSIFATGAAPRDLDGPTDATQVLVIDYAPVDQNPDRLIRRIRDEIVEVQPGVFLGKILYREDDGEYSNLGFFALRTP
jgi:hypothetical protein